MWDRRMHRYLLLMIDIELISIPNLRCEVTESSYIERGSCLDRVVLVIDLGAEMECECLCTVTFSS